jgi:serine/threonine protein phosphatase 1
MNTLIVGDIHGCHLELLDLLAKAGIGEGDLLVSVGDLVDRGPDPGAVVDLFRSRPGSVALMGNHERKHARGVLSYGQEVTRQQLAGRYEADVAWMRALPYHLERPDVRAVHLGHFPGTPLDEVPEDVRAGTSSGEARLRERFGAAPWWEHYHDAVPIAFGHHVVGREPLVVRDRVFGLDTGACHGGALSGLLLPSMRLVSVPARADHWAAVRSAWQAPVLRTHAWGAMTFEKIDRKLRTLRDPELGDGPLDAIGAWLARVRAALPGLRDRLDGELARLEREHGEDVGRAAAAHPAGAWLLKRRAGRLSETHVGCGTPADVARLGRALGVEVEEAPF